MKSNSLIGLCLRLASLAGLSLTFLTGCIVEDHHHHDAPPPPPVVRADVIVH